MGCEAAIVSEHSLSITPRKPRLAHGGFDDPHLQGGFRCHGWRHGMMWSVAAWAAVISSPTSTPVTLPSSLSARPATNTHVTFWAFGQKIQTHYFHRAYGLTIACSTSCILPTYIPYSSLIRGIDFDGMTHGLEAIIGVYHTLGG